MRQTTRWKVLGCVAASSVAAAFFAQACGGDSGNADGGPDATTNDSQADTQTVDVAQSDGATDAGSCPTYTGSAQFCTAAVARCNACGPSSLGTLAQSACERAHFSTICDGYAAIFSQAVVTAETTCESICDQDASNACAKGVLADASLTTAQTKVATDYCARCSDGGGCVTSVEQKLNLVEYSDTLANAVDTQCADAGCTQFTQCLTGVILGSLPPNPCADAAAD